MGPAVHFENLRSAPLPRPSGPALSGCEARQAKRPEALPSSR